jgi:hypothetical protein
MPHCTPWRALYNFSQNTKSFVLALVDGDGALFIDTLTQAGKEGGARAAQELFTAIKSHITSLNRDFSEFSIMVNIYANLAGLANKMVACGLIEKPADFRAWVNAFTLNQPFFNFIDVGDLKERADHKIKGKFQINLDRVG